MAQRCNNFTPRWSGNKISCGFWSGSRRDPRWRIKKKKKRLLVLFAFEDCNFWGVVLAGRHQRTWTTEAKMKSLITSHGAVLADLDSTSLTYLLEVIGWSRRLLWSLHLGCQFIFQTLMSNSCKLALHDYFMDQRQMNDYRMYLTTAGQFASF